jgi:cytochrome c-type biogenesis protein CcmH/NrfF
MYDSGKSPKEIYDLVVQKYGDLGEGTPTLEPKK